MAIEYEEYSYYDMIIKLNQKAEEMYSIGEITLQQKNYINEMKKALEQMNLQCYIDITNYSKSLVTSDNYNNILEEIADKCFILPKTSDNSNDIMKGKVSGMKIGDTIIDGEIIIEKVDYNILDDNVYFEECVKHKPYDTRVPGDTYSIDDIYNIGNASFKVIDTVEDY